MRLFLIGCLLLSSFCAFGSSRRTQRNYTQDWNNRVIANGGFPAQLTTIKTMETLRTDLEQLNLTNKIHALAVFVPDGVIPALTPLILNQGFRLWTNLNFTLSDLNQNGFKGNGTDKMVDSGVFLNGAIGPLNSIGITALITETDFANGPTISGFWDADGNQLYEMQLNFGLNTVWLSGGSGAANSITTNDAARVGYVSVGRDTNQSSFIDVASPLESHKRLATEATTAGGNFDVNCSIPFFCRRQANTNVSGVFTGMRVSMACVNDWFTETQSSNLWDAVFRCRSALGGGTGDPIHDWANRVVSNGGAAISTTTSNALRTFRQGLDTDALLYRIIALNAYAPDNLTAARQPLLFQAGNPIWTNTAFGSTNLTVDGLTGDGTTKFLGTGLFPFSLNYGGFSDTSAGISEIVYANPSTAAKVNLGAVGATGFQFSLYAAVTNALNLQFYCWTIATVNANFINVPRQSNWTGYLSGNRTAANAIAMYGVTNTVFNILTNSATSQTGNNDTQTNSLFAHALANVAVPAGISDQTVSLLALHSGFTQTQSSNLWNRARDFRNSIGGGVPP